MNKNWHVVYTRPRWEKKVAQLLTIKKIENYCPLKKTVHQWVDRSKVIYEPFFTSYVFVHISVEERLTVMNTEGVVKFVVYEGRPAVIRTEEMERIKDIFLNHLNRPVQIINHESAGQNEGRLVEKEESIGNSTYIRIFLPVLGFELLVKNTN